ncbi:MULTISPECIES: hypothetical protein [Azohydromonas]|jgi:hypothetical protein|uniref:Lipoprotein n=1 Tax=Azohydromonas lata TaxID=45677 RepID=A0ABU5I9A5_9BURK|nr:MULTISPECIES: hypothetical protein [Azohydromonas]MDZ5455681.1 hypothetical protein [Azohydromonas lata]
MSMTIFGASRQPTAVLAALAAALLQGCSAIPAAKDAYEQGWREARVVDASIGDEAIRSLANDCRTQASVTESRRFALLSYRDGTQGFARYVAAVPQDQAVKVERIYQVNVKDCSSRWYRVR